MFNVGVDFQLWYPGEESWELWVVEKGKGGVVETLPSGSPLRFRALPKLKRVLALPTSALIALPFISRAVDSKGLVQSAQMQVEKQGVGCDSLGIHVEPVCGSPPQTLARIDAPLLKADLLYQTDPAPDYIIAAATMMPLRPNSAAIWTELGQNVIAFENNGHTVFYDKLSSDGGDLVDEAFRLTYQLSGEKLIQRVDGLTIWNRVSPEPFEERFQVPVAWEPRPEPSAINLAQASLSPSWFRASQENQVSAKRKRGLFMVLGGVLGLILLGLISLVAFQLLQKNALKKEFARLKPQA
ncbi:MAG: hypothetical protein AAF226_17050, partial [Verrucomicrobiota bacterium]